MDRFSTAVPIAEGATSEVFRARDRHTGEPVALKILRSRDPELVRRLQREATVLARLDHPHIAPLVDAGETDGRPWLAMAFVDGAPIDQALRDTAPDEIVRIFLKVVDAVAYAHDRDLLHRDLKPANILVRRGDDGRPEPVVVDFGLARELDAPSETASGALLGTPAYMAPEQARGDREAVGRRTDLYGLGAVLYTVLAGRPPYTGGSSGDVIAAILGGRPQRPGPTVPLSLEAIVMRCLARVPAERYGSARELAADLEAWLEGRSVRAMRGYRMRLAGRLVARHRWAAVMVSAALVLGLALIVQQTWIRREAAARQTFALELAEDVAAARGRLRLVYLAPAHDIDPDLAFIEREVARLQALAASDLTREQPAVHFALGRLLLDAGRYRDALAALERARELGCGSAECAAALASAHVRLYQADLERQLEALDPDVEPLPAHHLEAAREAIEGVEVEGATAAIMAAITRPVGELDAVIENTLAGQPWRFEVLQARGEARYRAGLEAARQDALEAALEHFRRAGDDFARVVEIARSYPEAYLGGCRVTVRAMEITQLDRRLAVGDVNPGLTRCDMARRVAPGRVEAHTLPAAIHERLAMAAYRSSRPDAATAHIETAQKLLGDAPPVVRERPAFHAARARILATSVRAQALQGSAAKARFTEALASARRATDLDPDNLAVWQTWIHVVVGLVNTDPELTAGLVDDAASMARAMARRWPSDRGLRNALGTSLLNLAYHRRLAGKPDESLLRQSIDILERLVADAPGYARARNNLGMAWWELAVLELQQGGDHAQAEARSKEIYQALLSEHPDLPSAMVNYSSLNLTVADALIARGESPGDRIETSIELLQTLREQGDDYLACDLALGYWLKSQVADETAERERLRNLAGEHARNGDTPDCERVMRNLDLMSRSGGGGTPWTVSGAAGGDPPCRRR